MKDWHTINPQQTIELLDSDADYGLSGSEVKTRQQRYGKNELVETQGRSNLIIFWEQFTNVMVVFKN